MKKTKEAAERVIKIRSLEPTDDRILLQHIEGTKWAVSLNAVRPRTFSTWERALDVAQTMGHSHVAPIWIHESGQPPRLLKKP
jgi:hypothetical protein